MSRGAGADIGGGRFTFKVEGAYESIAVLNAASANVLGLDMGSVRMAKSEMRGMAKALAEQTATAIVRPLVHSSPAPQAHKIAETIRPKSDKLVIIRIGAVNPKLSGWRRGSGTRHKGSLAWGVEKGPHPSAKKNVYRVPRNEGGYAIGPNLDRIAAYVQPKYADIVKVAFDIAGVTSWGRF